MLFYKQTIIVAHYVFIIQILIKTLKEMSLPHLPTGTMVAIEGPRFSTRAESNMHRILGGTTIDMTTVPEVPEILW